jgi:hypothetical protein
MDLRDVTMKYDSAEIWWFKYGITLAIGTLNIMASTGVFVLVVCAFKRSMNTASKLGPHAQTDRGTCLGVGL